ncbi:Hsp20/alpha crystallin family protein [Halalkalicoccus salilacus]|uniref:Hsp20/alpha crystallin family protein n=1 Tax=Halalkalicoccus salilacus TaxID=3117459 RepID=UPI00300F6AF3
MEPVSEPPITTLGRSDDVELDEEDEAVVLSIEMPGLDREEIDLTWDDGRPHVDPKRRRGARPKAELPPHVPPA